MTSEMDPSQPPQPYYGSSSSSDRSPPVSQDEPSADPAGTTGTTNALGATPPSSTSASTRRMGRPPTRLYMPRTDHGLFSPYHVLIRQNVELFEATVEHDGARQRIPPTRAVSSSLMAAMRRSVTAEAGGGESTTDEEDVVPVPVPPDKAHTAADTTFISSEKSTASTSSSPRMSGGSTTTLVRSNPDSSPQAVAVSSMAAATPAPAPGYGGLLAAGRSMSFTGRREGARGSATLRRRGGRRHNYRPLLGQVGLRCCFCARQMEQQEQEQQDTQGPLEATVCLPASGRREDQTKNKRETTSGSPQPVNHMASSTHYPLQLGDVAQAAHSIANSHWIDYCHNIPPSVRMELMNLRSTQSTGTVKKAWVDSLRALGVVESHEPHVASQIQHHPQAQQHDSEDDDWSLASSARPTTSAATGATATGNSGGGGGLKFLPVYTKENHRPAFVSLSTTRVDTTLPTRSDFRVGPLVIPNELVQREEAKADARGMTTGRTSRSSSRWDSSNRSHTKSPDRPWAEGKEQDRQQQQQQPLPVTQRQELQDESEQDS